MKKDLLLLIVFLLLSGCAMYQTKKEIEPKKSFEEMVDIKLKQALAIAETSLEISKNAEKLSIEALNTSNQAKANSEVAIKKVDEAIAATNQVKKFTESEVQKAIEAANKASQEAVKAANEASQKAIDKATEAINTANEASQKAIDKATEASEKAIKAANEASERAIAVANQTIAEINKLRATIQMKPQEPIIEEEPKYGKYYVIQKGDTLKKIAYKFYNDISKWRIIYEANKKIIKNPENLTPGVKIYIP
ncbi:MAG: LysM peptidoglycan-binding domain-containing protein [Candidatus Omnitrophica bacterium]|nr:LysM peptidoglycan-binding domain-containing protein [Candidatus Omnitrophota bacterium]MCM8801697.1 LysM peptidoglycan-binding domain-containing protein [Candidatus Omnitrophota bacterium]